MRDRRRASDARRRHDRIGRLPVSRAAGRVGRHGARLLRRGPRGAPPLRADLGALRARPRAPRLRRPGRGAAREPGCPGGRVSRVDAGGARARARGCPADAQPRATASATTPRWSPRARSTTKRRSTCSSRSGARRSGCRSAARWPRSSGRGAMRSRRRLSSLRSRGSLVWIGNVNASTQFVLTGSAEGVKAALEELGPRALSVLPLTMSWPIHSELMRPVADAIAPLIARLDDRAPPRRAVLRPRGRAGRRRARTSGACSARRSAFRRCGRRPSRRWSPTGIVSSSKPGRARCSRRWRAGSIGPPAAFRPARSPAIRSAVDIVGRA